MFSLSYVGVPKILHSDNGRKFVNEVVESVVREWPGEVIILNGRPRNPKCQGLVEQGNHIVEKLLGVRLHEYVSGDYPPWSEWLSVIQCKYYHIYQKGCTCTSKKLNPLNGYEVGRCNCKSGCQGQKCSCHKLGSPCTSKCHQGTSWSNCPPSPMETPAKRRKVSCSSAAKSLVLQKQQSKHKSTAQTPTVIDLTFEWDTNETSSTGTHKKKVDTWVEVEDICLTTADQGILLPPTAWMNDNICCRSKAIAEANWCTWSSTSLHWADACL